MDALRFTPRRAAIAAGFALLAFGLAGVSSGFTGIGGWFSFLLLLTASAGMAAALFRALRGESIPGWLPALTAGAALLRLAAGVTWFAALPPLGHDTDVQNAGYVMADAFQRDTAAWRLARSEAPLSAVFRETDFGNFRSADQYGGLLFLSAALYRVLGGARHQPLFIVVLAAGLSALTVPLVWAFTRRMFDENAARWAAWIAALFPEAVLLGSSQMREAFVMPLAAAAVYGLLRYRDSAVGERRRGLSWMVASVALMLPLSPPFAGILTGLLVLIGLGLDDWRLLRSWKLWAVLAGMGAAAVIVIWAGWGQIAPRLNAEDYSSPFAMAASWFELSARWQARQTAGASGWVQKVFESTPEWFDLPFLIGYGISRPLLPAQLTAGGLPIWWAIGVWRALGWNILLLPLLYAPVLAFRAQGGRRALAGLALAAWIAIVIAAFWGGGDMWDNPRYRVAFIGLQAALAAQVVVAHQRAPDPWLRRLAITFLAVPVWLFFWYLRRYTAFDQVFGWTVIDLFKLAGAGLLTGVLLAVWDWAGAPESGPSR